MLNLKQGRWVRIHNQEQNDFEARENVMDITVGDGYCQAEAVYTAATRTYQKAAYWMLRYLGHAKAEEILAAAAEKIQASADKAGRDDAEVAVNGENWSCKIQKMAPGVFKTQISWTAETEEKTAEIPTPKKRSRRKKAA